MCFGQERKISGQHQDKIICTIDILQVSIMKLLRNFLAAATGYNRFPDSVKTARTD